MQGWAGWARSVATLVRMYCIYTFKLGFCTELEDTGDATGCTTFVPTWGESEIGDCLQCLSMTERLNILGIT